MDNITEERLSLLITNKFNGIINEFLTPIKATLDNLTTKVNKNYEDIKKIQDEIKTMKENKSVNENATNVNITSEIRNQIKCANQIFVQNAANEQVVRGVIQEILHGNEPEIHWLTNTGSNRWIVDMGQKDKQYVMDNKAKYFKYYKKCRVGINEALTYNQRIQRRDEMGKDKENTENPHDRNKNHNETNMTNTDDRREDENNETIQRGEPDKPNEQDKQNGNKTMENNQKSNADLIRKGFNDMSEALEFTDSTFTRKSNRIVTKNLQIERAC